MKYTMTFLLYVKSFILVNIKNWDTLAFNHLSVLVTDAD